VNGIREEGRLREKRTLGVSATSRRGEGMKSVEVSCGVRFHLGECYEFGTLLKNRKRGENGTNSKGKKGCRKEQNSLPRVQGDRSIWEKAPLQVEG